jgi:hypothetical protein
VITVLAAVLGAALAASASSTAPSPDPSAAATTASPAPKAGEGQEALRALLARELPPLPPRPFKTASGVTGKVEAAAALEVVAGTAGEAVTIPLGTQAPLTCVIFAHRIDAAASIWRVAEGAKAKVKLVAALPVEFVEVNGSALALAQLVYHAQSERGPLLGVVKLAVYVHPTRSVLCQHDEPGYMASFARIAKGLAASLGGGAPDPRAGATFAELTVVRVGPLAVGYVEHLASKRPGGAVVDEEYQALLLPRGAGDLVAMDGSSVRAIDAEGLLEHGSFVHVANGDADATMEVERGDDGKTYRYHGEKDGKRLEGSFATTAGIATDSWFARRFARSAPRPKAEVSHEAYAVETNPVAPVSVSWRTDPAAPRRVTLQQGAITLTGDLDANGMFEAAEMPLGPATLVMKRIWSRGTP